jgi:hypothetical protein
MKPPSTREDEYVLKRKSGRHNLLLLSPHYRDFQNVTGFSSASLVDVTCCHRQFSGSCRDTVHLGA